jgi:hypothetical protein
MKMKKTILTIAGSALIALSTVQLAAAASERHNKVHHRGPAAATQFRDSNAYAAPAYGAAFRDSNAYAAPGYGAAQTEWYRYDTGIWGQAGH